MSFAQKLGVESKNARKSWDEYVSNKIDVIIGFLSDLHRMVLHPGGPPNVSQDHHRGIVPPGFPSSAAVSHLNILDTESMVL